MIFFIHPKHTEAKIAQEDIICYKNLTLNYYKDLVSPLSENLYFKKNSMKSSVTKTTGKLYVDDLYVENYYVIRNGLYSYSTIEQAIEISKLSRFTHKIPDQDVFHAIIPKGTKYYYNPDENEYVSTKLIVNQFCKAYEYKELIPFAHYLF